MQVLIMHSIISSAEDLYSVAMFAFRHRNEALLSSVLALFNKDVIQCDQCSDWIHKCVENRWFDTLCQLLNLGADVNSYKNNKTALFYACESQQALMIDLLLNRGADPNAFDGLARIPEKRCDMMLPLQISVSMNDTFAVRALLNHGAIVDANSANEKVHRALKTYKPLYRLAFEKENKQISRLLLAYDVDASRETALHRATRAADVEKVEELLRYGANTNQKNCRGENALHIAFDATHDVRATPFPRVEEVVKLLLQHGADSSSMCDAGETPLF